MHVRVSGRVEDGEKDQTSGTDARKQNGESTQDLLGDRVILRKTSPVSKPSLRDKSQDEGDHGRRTAGDEERIAPITRANGGDVGNGRSCIHPWVVR